MGKPQGLVRRKGSSNWQFRVRVPSDLVEHFGATEKWVSLRTGDYATALSRWSEQIATWQAAFSQARRQVLGAPARGTAPVPMFPKVDQQPPRTRCVSLKPTFGGSWTTWSTTPKLVRISRRIRRSTSRRSSIGGLLELRSWFRVPCIIGSERGLGHRWARGDRYRDLRQTARGATEGQR